MLTMEQGGAQALLDLLGRIRQGATIPQAELDRVLAANAYFIDFYSGWDGCNREIIQQVIGHFDHPESVPVGLLPTHMAEGFRLALDDLDQMNQRLAWLKQLDISGLGDHILAYLPAGTPLDAVIHITVDQINNAFVYQGGMGVSLLKGIDSLEAFQEVVSHELHHVAFRYWSGLDLSRQKIIDEHSGRSVAVLHVDNLLMEGLANYYCTPGYVFRASAAEPARDPYQARLARLQREEHAFFQKAEQILALSLEPHATYEACFEALKAIAFDLEEAMQPAGHYLGARMVQTMETAFPRAAIIACIQRLADFLPRYNQAARKNGAFTFDSTQVANFTRLFE